MLWPLSRRIARPMQLVEPTSRFIVICFYFKIGMSSKTSISKQCSTIMMLGTSSFLFCWLSSICWVLRLYWCWSGCWFAAKFTISTCKIKNKILPSCIISWTIVLATISSRWGKTLNTVSNIHITRLIWKWNCISWGRANKRAKSNTTKIINLTIS